MGVVIGLALAAGLLIAGGAVGWVLGSVYVTIRAIEDQDGLWVDDDDDLR